MSYKGIDVSDNQGIINWADAAGDGVKMAILRSVRGSGKIDYQFLNNVNGCSTNGIPFDVYKYSYATTMDKAVVEAEAVISLLKSIDFVGTVWWDMEDNTLRNLGKSMLTKLINTAKERIEAAGYGFGVYCNRDWYENVLDVQAFDCPFWIARYPSLKQVTLADNPDKNKTPQVKGTHELFGWQYSSKGKVAGINGNVDLDMIYLDIDREESSTGENYVGDNPYPIPNYTLYRGRLGMSKEHVKWLQWEAKELGFAIDAHGGIDGNLGTYTEKVIGAIQVMFDLTEDKKCGAKTIKALCDRHK